MTTKFSQRHARQAEPPVCRFIIPELIPPIPPDWPNMNGFVDFKRTRYDDTVYTASLAITVPWIPDAPWWKIIIETSNYTLYIRIQPHTEPYQMYLDTHVWVTDADVLSGLNTGPVYTPGQPWESGDLMFHGPPPADYMWQTFFTHPL